MYRYVADLDGVPTGLFQHYRIDDHDDYGKALALDKPAIGVDLFIGEPDLIYKGHGPPMLRGFLEHVAFPSTTGSRCASSDPPCGTRRRSARTRRSASPSCATWTCPASRTASI